ncbi:FUSC family protein [Brucellaceae bacterium C25G]
MVPLLQSTVESAFVRIIVMIIVSFVFIFIGAASKLGEGGSIVALIIAFILSLISAIPINGIISTALRFTWEMGVLPMFVIAGFSLFFGKWSVGLLRDQLRDRLKLARDQLTNPNFETQEKLKEVLADGNDDANKKLMFTNILHQTSKQKAAQIGTDIPASYQLVYASAALAKHNNETERRLHAENISSMIDELDNNKPLTAKYIEENSAKTAYGKIIQQAINAIAGKQKPNYTKSENASFFAHDAFTNPVYQQFALKTTLAAILCYIFYSAINWNGIHTAMVTCYVASMGTTGDTVHKLTLRISGCLVGALIGVLSIVYILPQLDTVGGLMVLVFFATLLAGWVATGSEKISYAGVQIGLAFTLTVLQGFGPTTDMDSARDRIIGILVGNFAVYLVSVFLWPQPVSQSARDNLKKATTKLADLALISPEQRSLNIEKIAEVETILADIRYYHYLLPFEPHKLRPLPQHVETATEYADQLSELGKSIYFSNETMPEIAGRLRRLANHFHSYNLSPQIDYPPAETVGDYSNKHIAMQLSSLERLITGNSL